MQVEKREKQEFELFTGFAESKVLAICPDQAQLEEMGYSPESEPEYVKEDNEGVDTARIDIYFEEVKKGHKFKKSFFVKNQVMTQKPKEDWDEQQIADFIAKTQYVNAVGDSQWVTEEADLPQRFKNFTKKLKDSEEVEVYGDKRYREALGGEADLMAFLRTWLNGVDFRKASTDILLDTKKLFQGNFKELQELVGTDMVGTTVEPLTVKTVEKDNDLVQYQSVYKTSLPGYVMKNLRTVKFTPENIESWKAAKKTKENPKGRYLKNYEQFAIDITGEWGSKDYFELVPMKLYDPSDDTVGNGNPEPKATTTTGSDY